MRTNYKLFILALISLFIFNACENANVTSDGKQVTIEGLKKEPGFAWFDNEVAAYAPDSAIVKQIKAGFNLSTDKFYLFVKPSCGCVGTTKRFPNFYRVMREAGIADSNLVIYAMSTAEDNTPFKSASWKLNELPAFFRVKAGMPVYSIMDTFNLRYASNLKPSIESVIKESLAK
ncbi:MAG: hypothetical protein NTW25_10010 [Candidatus Kapabacteria bacterium]|nr:hypothetical protein [Candidatus Kapabacteria bacterium]